jgi:hypothetical protein
VKARIHRLRELVGWRGYFLLCFGSFDLVYGWTKLIHPDPTARDSQQLHLIGQLFPWLDSERTLLTWGYLWWAVGIICLVNAFRKDDQWGYGSAIGIKVTWIGANSWAWAHGLIGGGANVAIWVFILAVAIGCALRPENSPAITRMNAETNLLHGGDDDGPGERG